MAQRITITTNHQGAANCGPLVPAAATTIAAGATSQQVFAENPGRKYLLFQNQSAENMFLDFGINAVADVPAIRIPPGASFVMESSFVSGDSVHVIAATLGSKFTAKQG